MSTPISEAMAYAASITDVADCHADRCAVALWEEVLLLRARLAEVEADCVEIQRAWLGGKYGSIPSFFDAVSARINDAERERDEARSDLYRYRESIDPLCADEGCSVEFLPMWVNKLRVDLARWRTVADGLAEQLQQKEGYGPTANLKDYEAAKKGTP
jgi:hypothetical protein